MKVHIQNARLSFPDLWTPTAFDQNTRPKYGADLILTEDTKVFAVTKDGKKETTMEKVLKAVAKEAWKDKADKVLASLESRQKCLRNGDTRTTADGEPYEGYEGHQYVTAKNTAKPTVVDRDRTPLTEDDGKPYSGCYVNAVIDVYANTKPQFRGVFASLMGVQFAADGDAFGGGGTAKADEFDDLGDDLDEDLADDDDLL